MKLKTTGHTLRTLFVGGMLAANKLAAETLVSVGSDTLEHLMSAWSAEFNKQRPGVDFDLTAAGSSTAPPALVDGGSHFGPMGRKMKPKEVKAFETKHGCKPTAVRVALDALAVFAHKDNPIAGMGLEQVDAEPNAHGYSGIGYAKRGVRVVPLTKKAGSGPVEATSENAVSGE